jgi:hypothetical protein
MLEHCFAHFCFLEYRKTTSGHEHDSHGIFVARNIAFCNSGDDALQPL